MNYDYALKIIKAAQEGKKIQCRAHGTNWFICDISRVRLESLNNPLTYRIKPELKRVPVEVKDLPPVCHIRFRENSGEIYFLYKRHTALNVFWICGNSNSEWTVKSLPPEAEYSSDLITWHKFYKEVEV